MTRHLGSQRASTLSRCALHGHLRSRGIGAAMAYQPPHHRRRQSDHCCHDHPSRGPVADARCLALPDGPGTARAVLTHLPSPRTTALTRIVGSDVSTRKGRQRRTRVGRVNRGRGGSPQSTPDPPCKHSATTPTTRARSPDRRSSTVSWNVSTTKHPDHALDTITCMTPTIGASAVASATRRPSSPRQPITRRSTESRKPSERGREPGAPQFDARHHRPRAILPRVPQCQLSSVTDCS